MKKTAMIPAQWAAWSHVPEVVQARKLYDLGFGDVLGCTTFAAYLGGTDALQGVSQIPTFEREVLVSFGDPAAWFLVDGRVIGRIGLVEYCRRFGIRYTGTEDDFPIERRSGIYWMLAQDGAVNCGKRSVDTIDRVADGAEVPLNLVEGLAIHALHPEIVHRHAMIFRGTRFNRYRAPVCAGLSVDGHSPELGGFRHVDAHPRVGIATRANEHYRAPEQRYHSRACRSDWGSADDARRRMEALSEEAHAELRAQTAARERREIQLARDVERGRSLLMRMKSG